eukprot:m.34032 g.34032  ORF g.34032 m.34032 type:complete len:920 (+) comp9505_c1_seq1:131-2890(+)
MEQGDSTPATAPAYSGGLAALNLLTELTSAQTIQPDLALELKNAFIKLHTLYTDSAQSEQTLLIAATRLKDEALQKEAELKEGSAVSLEEKGTVADLKRELLKASNELAMAITRDLELKSSVERFRQERHALHDELLEIQHPAQAAIDPEITRLKTTVGDLQHELSQRVTELELLRTQRDQRLKRLNDAIHHKEASERSLGQVRDEHAALAVDPQRISKQGELLAHTHASLKGRVDEAGATLQQLARDTETLLTTRKEQQHALEQADLEHQRSQTAVDVASHLVQQLTSSAGVHESTRSDLLGKRALLEAEHTRAKKDLKTVYEQTLRLTRDKEKGLKALRAINLRVDQAQAVLDNSEKIKADMQQQLDARKREGADFAAIIPTLKREVEQLTRTLETQGALGADTLTTMRQAQAAQQVLSEELGQAKRDYNASCWSLRCTQTALAQAQNEVARAQTTLDRNQDTILLKKQMIADCASQLAQLQRVRADTDAIYQVVKTENNKFTSQIGAVAQREGDMREKIKVLYNEIEIMRASIVEKNVKISRQAMLNGLALASRDSLRVEAGQVQLKSEELMTAKKSAFNDNKNLLDVLTAVEASTQQILQACESSARDRDETATRLQERQAEVAAVYEKLQAIAAFGRTADMSLNNRNEELRFLKLERVELQRVVEMLRARLPEKHKLEQDLTALQMELLSTQQEAAKMESTLTQPSHAQRWRQLGGADADGDGLVAKIEDLEKRLAAKEATALERELVLAETTKLTERARKQVEAGRSDTITVSKAVQDYQSRVREITRKMMALIAELSMQQASSMQLQQAVHERRCEVEEALERLQRGEAPTEEALRDWEREVRREMQAQQTQMERASEAASATATMRPNAYLPDVEGELPIARPYGPFAPFKPAEQGSSMRHVRKSLRPLRA